MGSPLAAMNAIYPRASVDDDLVNWIYDQATTPGAAIPLWDDTLGTLQFSFGGPSPYNEVYEPDPLFDLLGFTDSFRIESGDRTPDDGSLFTYQIAGWADVRRYLNHALDYWTLGGDDGLTVGTFNLGGSGSVLDPYGKAFTKAWRQSLRLIDGGGSHTNNPAGQVQNFRGWAAANGYDADTGGNALTDALADLLNWATTTTPA